MNSNKTSCSSHFPPQKATNSAVALSQRLCLQGLLWFEEDLLDGNLPCDLRVDRVGSGSPSRVGLRPGGGWPSFSVVFKSWSFLKNFMFFPGVSRLGAILNTLNHTFDLFSKRSSAWENCWVGRIIELDPWTGRVPESFAIVPYGRDAGYYSDCRRNPSHVSHMLDLLLSNKWGWAFSWRDMSLDLPPKASKLRFLMIEQQQHHHHASEDGPMAALLFPWRL